MLKLKRFLPIIIFLFISLAIMSPALAQPATELQNYDKTSLLEYKVGILEDTNEKILNVTYWALGGFVGIFLVIIALNFYQNFSLNKKKVESIKEELLNDLKNKTQIVKDDIVGEVENIKKSIQPAIENKLKETFSKVKEDITIMKGELLDAQEDLLEMKLEKWNGWKGTRVPANIITTLIDLLNFYITTGYKARIIKGLTEIDAFISDAQNQNCIKDSFTQSRLYIALDRLPADYSSQKDKIKNKL